MGYGRATRSRSGPKARHRRRKLPRIGGKIGGMNSDFAYDPVTAIDEAAAVGETAQLFAEIRRTMGIPLVTSIWRGLAGMDDCLRLAWDAAKPIYKSGEPEQALARSIMAASLPAPEPLAPTA